MSVVFDQLRISDDGQKMYIDAHVNKAAYFDAVTLQKITICTEDQVSESNPSHYGENFIYQQIIEPITSIVPVYGDPQILSADDFIEWVRAGHRELANPCPVSAEQSFLSVILSGKYETYLDTGYAPKLVVASSSFDPSEDGMNSPEILFTVDGEKHEEKGHTTFLFKGKGEITGNSHVYFYLYAQSSEGVYVRTGLDMTDDKNFCHFLWNFYYTTETEAKKELHLVLNPYQMLPTFTGNSFSNNMFFVYIETEGEPVPEPPCTLDETTNLAVTFDYGTVFNQAMNYTKELGYDCNVPQNFINFILNYDALKLAVETEHYVPAIQFWKALMGMDGNSSYRVTKPCGCHG